MSQFGKVSAVTFADNIATVCFSKLEGQQAALEKGSLRVSPLFEISSLHITWF